MEKVKENFIVTEDLSGMRFDQAVAKSLKRFSRNQLKGWIKSGNLTLDYNKVQPKTKILEGQIINLDGGEVVGNSGEFNLLQNLPDSKWELVKKLSI